MERNPIDTIIEAEVALRTVSTLIGCVADGELSVVKPEGLAELLDLIAAKVGLAALALQRAA